MTFSALELWTDNLAEHRQVLEATASIGPGVVAAIGLLEQTISRGGKILICGNGGSAADAQHIASEFTGRFIQDRPPLAALALSTDTSAITCISNDYTFDDVFQRQITALGKQGDALIAISTSGNSQNVVKAAAVARALGLKVVGLLGRDGGELKALCDVALVVQSRSTARIQEMHILIGHTLCGGVEQALNLVPVKVFDAGVPSLTEREKSLHPELKGQCWQQARIGNLDELLDWRAAARMRGEKIIMTNGCFDLLHPGHLDYLARARQLGDRLVVAVNDDASVQRLKGATRPVNPLNVRQQMLASLAVVDFVVSFPDDTPEGLYRRVLPDVLVKGGDYCAENVIGGDAVRAAGGKVTVLPFLEGYSTTSLLARIQALTTD